jgi:hypothetical protein
MWLKLTGRVDTSPSNTVNLNVLEMQVNSVVLRYVHSRYHTKTPFKTQLTVYHPNIYRPRPQRLLDYNRALLADAFLADLQHTQLGTGIQ